LQNTPAEALELPGLRLAPLPFEAGSAKFDLNLALVPTPSGITGGLTYKPDLFDAATIDRLAGHLVTLLAGAAADPEVRLADLPLLTGPERQALREWNGTAAGAPAACLHELVAAQARRQPEAVAVSCAGAALSYGELDARAALLSRHLRRLRVGPEVLVGVCAERSLALVVGLLAVLGAGGAYLPLDPSYPRERLLRMLEDARPAVLLVEERTAVLLPAEGCPRIFLDAPLAAAGGPLPNPAAVPVGPENLAYVIFTSGSTGRPKGAMNSHRGIVNRLLWPREAPELRLSPADRVLQMTPISFDFSVWELFAPLVSGACLVMARPGGQQDPAYLARILAEQAITLVHFVPPMLQAFLAEPEAGRAAGTLALRRVMTGGEALPVALAERFFARFPGVGLYNQYGPTEAAVDVTAWACPPGAAIVPIGRPVTNTRLLLLDTLLRPVPVGVTGELHIGGAQVARGYLGRPELTAERFLPDPEEPGARMYRTGDLARHRAGGEIEYLGRLDHQVKIRGIRIELGEVEAALATHEAVREAVVLVREEGGDRRLVGYLSAAAPAALPDTSELRRFLRALLPEPMVPAAFVVLPALPLLPSGKVDRGALARLAPELDRAASPAGGSGGSGSPVEELLAGIWAGVLGVERVGGDEDFFALGGHSLLATQVMSRVRAACGIELPLRALFEHPTVAGLAREVLGARRTEDLPPIERVPRTGDLPLSFAQQRLWFFDRLEPGRALYNIPLAARLDGPLSVPALAASCNEIARRHEALRTSFALRQDRPVQVIAPRLDLAPALVDLAGLPGQALEPELQRLAAAEAGRPFDLARGPLVRAVLARLDRSGEAHALLLTLHHTVSDGGSTGIFRRELAVLYGELSTGGPVARPVLPELPIQYADYAVWQRQWLAGDVLARQLAFWRERLAGAPAVLELPTDRPRPPVQTFRGGIESLRLPAELAAEVRQMGVREGSTLFMLLLASFAALLARHSGQDDVVVGTPVANRSRLETEGLIGFFVNTLVLR
ncbi:MAG TPA: amino acid adenylation domain-containing protein, partial [Thermoanaerobaculia bacterium]|nr:amino acid adenylation domain-containing protein [Thermoanaerobaculia bacterium]